MEPTDAQHGDMHGNAEGSVELETVVVAIAVKLGLIFSTTIFLN